MHAYSEHRKVEVYNDYYERRPEKPPGVKNALDGISADSREAFAPGVVTGFAKLDKAVRLSPGRLVVLGARPGTGKTTLATQIAVQVLQKSNQARVLYCSVEMDAAEIGLKALSCLSGYNCIEPFENRDEEKIEHVYTQMTAHMHTLSRLEVLYGTSLQPILDAVEYMRHDKEFPLVLLIVDFITSIIPEGDFGTRSEAVGSVSRALKKLAKINKIPVLCCAQLNRGVASAKAPSMRDLRDSGEIEQDADSVMLLHRPKEEVGAMAGKVEIVIDKNRFGTMDSITLWPELDRHRFKEG